MIGLSANFWTDVAQQRPYFERVHTLASIFDVSQTAERDGCAHARALWIGGGRWKGTVKMVTVQPRTAHCTGHELPNNQWSSVRTPLLTHPSQQPAKLTS
jgi:hypothetical protein